MAKANDIDLDVVETKTGADAPPEYLKLNPLGRIPTFEGEDGYVLTEAIAIAIYSKWGRSQSSRSHLPPPWGSLPR